MKTCLNKKCQGEVKLLYDYGSNYKFDDINFDCTTNSYSKPRIFICRKCNLKFSELAVNFYSTNISIREINIYRVKNRIMNLNIFYRKF